MTMVLLAASAVPFTASGTGGTQEKGKETCTWEMNGITWTGAVLFPVGTSVATQTLTLRCPNHIELGEAQYGYKDCRSFTGECLAPLGDIDVKDMGRTDEPKLQDPTGLVGGCGWSRTWEVTAPNVNTYVFWFRVHTLKDADCDKKPDDWNQEQQEGIKFEDAPEPTIWRQTNTIPPTVVNYGDGSLDGDPCAYANTFYSGRLSFSKPPYGGGLRDPRAPGYAPVPDGEVNECDWQTYEWQWRQWN